MSGTRAAGALALVAGVGVTVACSCWSPVVCLAGDADPMDVVDRMASQVLAVLRDGSIDSPEKRRRVEEIAYAHVDFETGRTDRFSFGEGHWLSEAVFTTRHPSAEEGDGCVVSIVYRPDEARSDLVVFDARHIDAGPVAVARLDTRVPNGFHAEFRAA